MGVMPKLLTAAVDKSRLQLVAHCVVPTCGYEEDVEDVTGRYCPYCAHDLEHELEER